MNLLHLVPGHVVRQQELHAIFMDTPQFRHVKSALDRGDLFINGRHYAASLAAV